MVEREKFSELPELGGNVKRERLARHWSQDELATASGVSKAMLSQIESGKVNPTIGTLWKIAHALEVDFNLLLRGKHRKVRCFEVGRRADLPLLESTAPGVELRVLSGIALADKLEFYDLKFEHGAELVSAAHYPGTEELVTVIAGKVLVCAGERETELNAGDVVRFDCDVPHRIRNIGDGMAALHMIVRFTDDGGAGNANAASREKR